MFLLNEEKPEYHMNLGRTNISNLQWNRAVKLYSQSWRNRFAGRPVVNLIYHARHATESFWSRTHRWNYSAFTIWGTLIFATFMNLIFTLNEFFSGYSLPSESFPIFFATIMPVLFNSKVVVYKKRFLSHDLMMPVSRDAYLKQVGMFIASRLFVIWGVYTAVTVLFSMFVLTLKPTLESLIYSISYSLMIQIWLFGLAIWNSSIRSTSISIVTFIAAILLAFPVFIFDSQVLISWWPLVILFGGQLAVIGLLLAWWGYRRWLVADLN